MAAVSGVRAATATLVAATVDTVTLSGGGDCLGEIVNHSSADPIYYRSDGTNPVSAAAENEIVLAGERVGIRLPSNGAVRLISAGTPTYTVVAHK